MTLSKYIEHIAKSKITPNEKTEYGVITSFDFNTNTCSVKIEGFTFNNIKVQAGYIPQVNEDVIVINKNGDRLVQAGYNPNYSDNQTDNIKNIINIEVYNLFGNHIRNGANREAMLSTYDDINKQFIINKGEMNIKGSIINLNANTIYSHDTSTLAAGVYYLIVDNTLSFSIQSNSVELLDNQLPLLEINISDITNIIYTDIRPTTKIS